MEKGNQNPMLEGEHPILSTQQYPLAPQGHPEQFHQQNHGYPAQYVQQQYAQQTQTTIYQQPMGLGQVISQPYIAPIGQKEMYLEPNGRQDAGLVKKSGLQKLEEQNGIFIKQKLEFAELVLGCEMENRYNVYALNTDGNKKGRQMFKAKEKSGFWTRCCLNGDCRPFKMDIANTIRGEEEDEYEPFLHLDRPCKWTCFCCNRPELKITLVEGGRNEYIGKIVDPFNWCHLEMDIYDKDNIHKYTILGHCCQLGLWCQCPCEPCQNINFAVKTASGEVVSQLQKRSPGCLQATVTDMDNFAMVFPNNCTTIDKALLMSAILMLDYRHFERNPQTGS